MRSPLRVCLLFSAICFEALAGSDQQSVTTPTAEQLQFFETRVRPVLAEHCLNCHGAKKQWAGLRLDSREAILTGGDSGPAIVPGAPEESLLVRAIRHDDENLKMPQDGRLTDAQITDLVEWIGQGAAFPDSPQVSERHRDPNHWSFQPPLLPDLPTVKSTAWPQSDPDRFILSEMEKAGIAPAAKADRETLLRRVTFDLTGLPPGPEELDAFLNDHRPEAWSAVIDRLLASPAYGEKWGRHWLDVARYADSNGLDENIAHGNAWRYRDYVVSSFYRDKPFNQFVIEQLTGDLLPAGSESERQEHLTATGFLSIGPKVLAEVNQAKMRMDIVDEQIDTVGRVFLGMTFGCARCHDHKFDPIATSDYYGLAGIFKSTKTMDSYTKVAKWHEHPLQATVPTSVQAAYDADLAARKQRIETVVMAERLKLIEAMPAGSTLPENAENQFPESIKAELTRLREELAKLEKEPPEIPAAMGVIEDEIADAPIHVRGNPLRTGDVVARHVPPVIRGPETPVFSGSESGRRQLAAWLIDPRHPLTARVTVNRIWNWHFGRGLVRTTDNFGLLGEPPSHPELLDWLALRFIADGWSVKSLHRLILTSATYQQSSQQSADVISQDPENRLFARFSVRRLEAEEIRDAILAVSGQLDPTVGGSLLKIRNRAYLFDHTSIDLSDYTSTRRSLYLPVIRNNVYDLFQLLDFPDPAVPTGSRSATTVAPQALLMMNSELVMQSADALARRLQRIPDDEQRIIQLYRAAFGRNCTASELSEAMKDLSLIEAELPISDGDNASRRLKAWGAFCHVTLASNEFIYIQ